MLAKKYEILAFLSLLTIAIVLRFEGLNWDQGQLLHPDERFLVMVQDALIGVDSLRQYFDTSKSTLNPHNQGFDFYVYGSFPLFSIKGLSILGRAWGGELPQHLYGRIFSATCDVLTVTLVFSVARILFGPAAALLAMLLSTFSALQIQHAHFGVVDSSLTLLVTLAFLFAILLGRTPEQKNIRSLLLTLALGLIVGLAAATKITGALIGIIFIPAMLSHSRSVRSFLLHSIIVSSLALLTFRTAQPYAFAGPDFLAFNLNPKWLANMKSLSDQAGPSLGFPPAVQWFNRSHFFGLKNMIVWGLGLPLGIISGLALLWWCRELLKLRAKTYAIIVVCGVVAWLIVFGFYPAIVSLRYLLPIYPSIYILTAGALILCLKSNSLSTLNLQVLRLLLLFVAVCAPLWGLAFASIYSSPHTRVKASDWILRNVPGPISLKGRCSQGEHLLPIPIPGPEANLSANAPISVDFTVPERFLLQSIEIPSLLVKAKGTTPSPTIILNLLTPSPSDCVTGSTTIKLDPTSSPSAEVRCILNPGQRYTLQIETKDPTLNIVIRKQRIAHETSWDDGLPLRLSGYDPYAGIYNGDNNLELFWEDNSEKLARLVSILSQADYIFITSNRVWGSAGRLPKHYPIVQNFYRSLLPCQDHIPIFNCYAEAQASQVGDLGYKLVGSFISFPNLFGLSINDQYAEEAFTVYDHPKVMIFKRIKSLSPEDLASLLDNRRSAIYLSND